MPWIETLVLALVFAFFPEWLAVRRGVVLEPHLGWIAVLLLSARYGIAGYFAGLVAAAVAVGSASAIASHGLIRAWQDLDTPRNLVVLAACLAVAGVASWHLRRQADLNERLRVMSERRTEARTEAETLRGVVEKLRTRVDRTWTSLAFLRDAAQRLDGVDSVAAAEGAADLAQARSGASAVAIRVGMGRFQRLLTVRDARGPGAVAPLSISEADVTVTLRDGKDALGVLALWGVQRHPADDATTHDLEVIASWCAGALRRHHVPPRIDPPSPADHGLGRPERIS
jgi:hypothetical protein